MNLSIKECEDTNNCTGARFIYNYVISRICISVYMIYISDDTMQSTFIFWYTIHQTLPQSVLKHIFAQNRVVQHIITNGFFFADKIIDDQKLSIKVTYASMWGLKTLSSPIILEHTPTPAQTESKNFCHGSSIHADTPLFLILTNTALAIPLTSRVKWVFFLAVRLSNHCQDINYVHCIARLPACTKYLHMIDENHIY